MDSMSLGLRIAYFLSLLLVALALAPAMAHLLALPNKVGLPREEYFAAQQIYRGWALLGIVVFAALLSTAVLTMMLYGRAREFALSLVTLLCIAAAIAVFLFSLFQRIKSPITGRTRRTIGSNCGASGNIPTPQARRFI
jgi:hypothetical protein